MPLSNTEITSLLDGSSSGRFSASEFLNQITANNASANQATEVGLKLLHDSGYSPSEAASLWNDAFGTKFTAEDYTTSLNNYGIEKVAKPQIAVFGDSISSSVGYALDGKGGGYSDTTYGNNLAQYLGQSLKVNAANNSMGGTTTSDSLTGTGVPYAGSALPIEYGNFANYITENKPETAVLRFGAADAIRLNNADTTLKNIEEMVKVSEANGTKPILVGVTPFAKMGDFNAGNIDAGITDSMIASANAINKGIQDLASKYGVQFIDVRQVPVTQGALLDGVHPSGEYGAALNNYIANEIKDSGVFKTATKVAEPTAMSTAPKTLAALPTEDIVSGSLSQSTAKSLVGNTPNQTIQNLISSGAFEANQNNPILIDGTYYQPIYSQTGSGMDAQQGPLENVVTYKESENKVGGNVNYYSPSGEYQQTTQQQEVNATKDFMDFALKAGTLFGLPASIGQSLGLGTNALSQAVGQGLLTTGTQLGGGASLQDALKAGLIGGGAGYLGSYLNTAGGAVLGDASDIAMSMADAGSTLAEIETALTNSGFSADVVAESLKDAANTLAPRAIDIPSNVSSLTDAVNVVGQNVTPSLSNLISTIATIPSTAQTQVTAPTTTQTLNVEAAKTPQQVDQRVLDLVNSQIASNVTTPSNLANVQVTAPKTTTTQDVINTIAATIPATPVTTPTAVTPEQVITSNKPATVQDIVTALTSTIPITNAQATYVAEQVISSNKPVTTQDVINAITSVIPTPTVTPTTIPTTVATTPEVKVTAPKTVTTQDIINAITTVVPTAVTPPVVPTTTITAQKPSTITDVVTAATIPLIQPTTPLTPTEVKAQQDLTNSEKIRLAQLGLTAAGLLGAGAAVSGGPTQYDIVPVPTDWTSPQTIAQTWNYPRPIDFGNRNLLMGTQWEKFLDPNYGRVPEPVKFSQPSNLSYTDLMGILGSKQGMPSSSNLSINDIISGIQNQYGQVPSRTMG
jgi:lysophospholipase L1-like esterase